MAMTAFRYRIALVAGLLPAMAAVSVSAAPPVATPTNGSTLPAATFPSANPPASNTPAATPPPAMGAASAEGDALEKLVKDSPFLPAAAGAAASGQTGPLELRSIIMDRGSYYFSLYDLNSKESFWVGLNEPGFPAVVRNYDRNSDTVTVEQQGRTMSLTLATARTMAASPAMAVPAQAGGPGGPPIAAGASASGGPTIQPSNGQAQFGPVPSSVTPDEAQRLQRIADEIRRRRAVGKATPSAAPTPTPTPPKP